jgi:hypothetical protein
MRMTDLIAQFCDDIQFDALEGWCDILRLEYNPPLCDDDYPGWEDELRVQLANAMGGVGK